MHIINLKRVYFLHILHIHLYTYMNIIHTVYAYYILECFPAYIICKLVYVHII